MGKADDRFWVKVRRLIKRLPKVRYFEECEEGLKIYFEGGSIMVNWEAEVQKSKEMKGNWWRPEVGDHVFALILDIEIGEDMRAKIVDLKTGTEYLLPRHEYLRKALRPAKVGDIYYIELIEKTKDRRLGIETYRYHVVERNDLKEDPEVRQMISEYLDQPPF